MKIRLSWKLFGVMMINVILIVGVMVVIMNLLVSREFQGYIRANDLERFQNVKEGLQQYYSCLLYTSPSPRDGLLSRMPSSA